MMTASLPFTFFTLLFTLLSSVAAQQFAGDHIPNTLQGVPGSELSYFRIADPAGLNNNLTLINYYSTQEDGTRLDPTQLQRAVIVIHGLNEDPGTYMSQMLSALSQETSDPNVNFSSVAILAPFFVNGDSKGTSYPWSTYNGSTSNALVWKGSQWSAGANNQYPKTSTTVSSFEALDQMIKYFDNTTMFPNMQRIVVAGHSLGGQTVHRYAEIGHQLDTLSPVTYWIGNPDSLAWLSTSRPIASMEASCPTYDNWRDGFSNFTQYPMSYGVPLVKQGRSAVLANFNSKSRAWARGILDLGDDASTCGPYTTGINRNERFFNFIKTFPPACAATNGQCDTVDYIDAGHDAGSMFASEAGRTRLFLDGFYGDGTLAYDFGYPRLQPGDDPFPDPELKDPDYTYDALYAADGNLTYIPLTVGNMTYQGCWTDDWTSQAALSYKAYDNTNNTVEQCVATCAGMGYAIAGLEYGSQCFCDNTISAYSDHSVNGGCTMSCPGNSSEICGNSNRLSVYSAAGVVQNAVPVMPADISNYGFYSCMTEATNGRALASNGYMDASNMTLEGCASFCEGYQYFGVEYSAQCYCGASFGAGANLTSSSDCSMTCSGNSTELCGGPNRLSVYSMEYPLAVASSSSSSLASTTVSTTAGPSSTTPSTTLSTTSTSSVEDTSSSTTSSTFQYLSSSSTLATSSSTASAIASPISSSSSTTQYSSPAAKSSSSTTKSSSSTTKTPSSTTKHASSTTHTSSTKHTSSTAKHTSSTIKRASTTTKHTSSTKKATTTKKITTATKKHTTTSSAKHTTTKR